jgi:hypothetical protein
MRNSISRACVGFAFLCMTPTTGFAKEKSYVCAINEVYECVTQAGAAESLLRTQTSRGSWCSISKRSSFAQRRLVESLVRTTLRVWP